MTALAHPTVADWSPRDLVVDRVAAHAIAEARRIFVLQRQARWKVARSTGAERQQKLRALGEAIARRRGEIAEAI